MDYFVNVLPIPDVQYDVSEFLKPASKLRREFTGPHFYQCLPMVSANTLGWTLYNPFEFSARWNGGGGVDDVSVTTDHPDWVKSWFGHGTFSIHPQFIVRTSPGIDLLIRAVPNHFKPAVMTFDGIVETDWIKSSFTINFRLTMPLVKVTFAVDEPLVQFVPYPRDFVENFVPQIVDDGENYADLIAQFASWQQQRRTQIEHKEAAKLDYLRGKDLDGSTFPNHKRAFHLLPFTRNRPAQK